MKKLFWFTVIIAVLASFFASANPDGLEYIAEKLGFLETARERTAPMPDYSLTFLPEGGISTATAGVAGILITLAVFWLAAYVMKKGENGMNKKMVVLFLALLVVSAPAFAARPLVTDDFGTVDPGKYELEAGLNSTAAGGATANGAGVSFKRGFTDSFDLGLEAPYSITAPTGLGDAVINAKYKIAAMGEDEGLTAKLSVKLTNGDTATGLGTGQMDYTLTAIYSKPLAGLNTHFNLGYTLVGVPAGSPAADTVNYGAAVEKELSDGLELVGELYGNSAAGSGNSAQVGGRWQVNDLVRLDAGYTLSLTSGGPTIMAAGLTAEF